MGYNDFGDAEATRENTSNKPRPMTLADWELIRSNMQSAEEHRAQMLISMGQALNQDRSDWKVLYPLQGSYVPLFNNYSVPRIEPEYQPKYLSLAISDVPLMVQKYIDMVETERTNRLCKCEWIVHPDDVEKAEGTRRVHKGAEAPDCPVHTKYGFLIYFFDHYFHSKCPACPPDCKSCLFNRDCECYEHGNQHVQTGLFDSELGGGD